MTHITRDDVLQLAALSSLSLNEGEVRSLQADLSQIVGFISKLSELDTSNVEPTYQVTDLHSVYRNDEVSQLLERNELMAVSSHVTNHHINVPKVL